MRCGILFVNMFMAALSSRGASSSRNSSDKSCATSSPMQCVPADGMPCTQWNWGWGNATRRKGCERPGSGTQGADDCSRTHNPYIHTHIHTTHFFSPLLPFFLSHYFPPSLPLPLPSPPASSLSLLPLTLKHCCSLYLWKYLHTLSRHNPSHTSTYTYTGVCERVLRHMSYEEEDDGVCVWVCAETYAQAHTYTCIYMRE